ncbi:vWA domain-containing protein [Actinocorallia longicatena]|uniref:VWFA domain-containing protein n=1 Tax=Actinocorallia longicatena TaxID=111803 RepID=A0ABP6Q445_9ACTN
MRDKEILLVHGYGGVRPSAAMPRPLPVLVLADVSGSMSQHGKIEVLNECVATMIRSFAAEDVVRGEINVGVVTFGGEGAQLHQPFQPATRITWQEMRASGRTPMGDALTLANEILHDDAVIGRRAFVPTLILVSDGQPTDPWQEPMDRLLASPRGAKSVRMAVSVGADDGEGIDVLSAFAHPLRPRRADEAHELSRYFAAVTMSVTMRVRSTRPNESNTPFSEDELDDLLG